MQLSLSKETFLPNNANREKFISMLADELSLNGCHVIQAETDADLELCLGAVECPMQ